MPSKATYIFIDESGSFGDDFDKGASKIILVGFGFFPNIEYKTHIDNTKKMIKTKSGVSPRELKFSDATPATRTYLLNRLVECNGVFGCIYLDKTEELCFNYNHVEDCYNEMVSDVVTRIIHVAHITTDVNLFIDRRSQNKNITKGASRYLKKTIKPVLCGNKLNIGIISSHASREIQCADFICGSFYQKLERGILDYYKIIERDIIIEERFKQK